MTYTIKLRPSALRDLKRLPKDVLDRVSRKIDSLTDNPRPPGVEKLSGSEDFYRVRLGEYRILCMIRDKMLLVLIVKVRRRREAYRN